jgi:hypothetical protein
MRFPALYCWVDMLLITVCYRIAFRVFLCSFQLPSPTIVLLLKLFPGLFFGLSRAWFLSDVHTKAFSQSSSPSLRSTWPVRFCPAAAPSVLVLFSVHSVCHVSTCHHLLPSSFLDPPHDSRKQIYLFHISCSVFFIAALTSLQHLDLSPDSNVHYTPHHP